MLTILLIILFTLELIFNIYFMIKTLKTKNNKDWLKLLSFNISSIISAIIISYYIYINIDYHIDIYIHDINNIYYKIIISYISIFTILLITNIILKIINKTTKKLNKKEKTKSIILPLLIPIILSSTICFIDYTKYTIDKRGELITYIHLKNKELTKMTNYLNKKYNININKKDNIYYKEQNSAKHYIYTDCINDCRSGKTPFYAIFKINNENITVVDKNGFISDNWQLKDLNNLITTYFYKKTKIKFNYVEFLDFDNKIIPFILQTKFNKLINDENIDTFINYILQETNNISFYIKDNSEIQRDTIIKQVSYLKNYSNIYSINIYRYNEISIKHKEPSLSDNYDIYKFGSYYVDKTNSKFTSLLNYSPNTNKWEYKDPTTFP